MSRLTPCEGGGVAITFQMRISLRTFEHCPTNLIRALVDRFDLLFNLCAHEGRLSNAYRLFHVFWPVRCDDSYFDDWHDAQTIESNCGEGEK
jgi:hypothetical protein